MTTPFATARGRIAGNPLHAELARLREDNERLAAELAELRELAAPKPTEIRFPGVRLTASHSVIILLLIRRAQVSREQLHYALYQGEARTHKCVDVLMVQVRRKLGSLGVTVNNTYGRGWWIEPADQARLSEMNYGASS